MQPVRSKKGFVYIAVVEVLKKSVATYPLGSDSTST